MRFNRIKILEKNYKFFNIIMSNIKLNSVHRLDMLA